ncbi:MAG: nicotinate-nucleotide adenylyltransferase [Alphaproteobacteria bacterium]|nr:nicotinate-nucleotide adenylyltransferase [Alphaproteobacteria bacterium]
MKHHCRPHLPPRLPGPSAGLRIGVMGGSFDPPHSGHIHLMKVARRRLGLDWIWILPATGNPLKHTTTAFRDRLAAARRTLAGPRVRISALEADLHLTYTIDLVRALKRLAPDAHFVWIMGGDNLGQFHRWRRWREIAETIPIAVVSRPGSGPTPLLSRFARTFADARIPTEAARTLADQTAPAWVYLPAPLDPASSTDIRIAMMLAAPMPPI